MFKKNLTAFFLPGMKNQKAGRQVKLTDQDRKIITGLELNQHRKRKQSFIMHTEI